MNSDNEDKPLTRSQRRRREDLVRAALKVFDEHGFEAARMDDVAREAEVAKGTVYLYFKNKEDLFQGMVRDVVGPALDSVRQAATLASRPPTERLEQLVRSLGRFLGTGDFRTILRLMIAEGPKHENLRQFYYSNIVEPGTAAIRQCLQDGEASGEFRQGSGQVAPQVLAGAPMIAAIWQILFADYAPLDTERLLDDHLKTVLGGLQVTAGQSSAAITH
ncbi:TetR/AcrR family transcriptional regulator [Marinobacter xestospongiae]|uniref:TetR/AcrR family transcriptional regulator n=1 Tax=Marinobacter xestospongiae TaxID=994319 RepID=UPI002002CC2B|nr:TetR/AcrR family transcriptional regulator [Marinobacter xestospongiae]MCK7566065.1 TetR/AcrR family transcriptional regulator [Marinobacter xestospongiae]